MNQQLRNMKKKEKLKLVFDFIAEYLSDEPKKEKTKNKKTTSDIDVAANHISEIMKRVDLMDKIKTKPTQRINPGILRDEDETDEVNMGKVINSAKLAINRIEKEKPIVTSNIVTPGLSEE